MPEEWKSWKTWGDVPIDVQAHLLEGPFDRTLELDAKTPLYAALQIIVAAGPKQ